MEGSGVLRAANLAGVPAVEVRVISNAIRDRRPLTLEDLRRPRHPLRGSPRLVPALLALARLDEQCRRNSELLAGA